MRLYERIALAAQHVQHRTLVQNHWSRKDAYDRTCVCLLRAFGHDINDPANCPVELMPEWLARLLPLINDGMPPVFYYDFAADFVGSAQHWATFQPSEWARIRSAMLMEITWHANALVEQGDQQSGHVFRDNKAGREQFDSLIAASRAITPALFDPAKLANAGKTAREAYDAAQRLHVGLGGRERRVVMAAQHAAHAAYRAADGSVCDAACYMARAAELVDVDRARGASWRHLAAVLMRLLGKEAVQ